MKVVCLWSGGKDSCFACYKAKIEGYTIVSIINFANAEGTSSVSHGLSAEIIQRQAQMLGIPFLQKPMPHEGYRQAFKELVNDYKTKHGIEGIVFGDIYLQEHRDWIDKVCEELKVKAILPVWTNDTVGLARQIIDSGFKAIVVSVKKDILGKEWLGRKVDHEFMNDLKEAGDFDLCGERGEFHTFVYDGPLFKKPVTFTTGEKVEIGTHYFLKVN